METDYPMDEDIVIKSDDRAIRVDKGHSSKSPSKSPAKSSEEVDGEGDSGIGGITVVQCATGAASHEVTPMGTPPGGEYGSESRSIFQSVGPCTVMLVSREAGGKDFFLCPESNVVFMWASMGC